MFITLVFISYIINSKNETILYEDNEYRVQENILSLGEPLALPNIYEKVLIIEKYAALDYPNHLETYFDTKKSDIKNIKINDTQDSLTVQFEFNSGDKRYLIKK